MAHLPEETLAKRLEDARKLVEVGASYVHYKGPSRSYKVTGLALLEHSDEAAVIYEWEYGQRLAFIRPLSDFLSEVEVGGARIPRFRKL